GTEPHGEKPGDHASLIADPLDQLARRNRKKEVSRKKAELDEHDLCVSQIKDVFQMRHQNIVQSCQEAPHEEQCCRHRHGALVGGNACGLDDWRLWSCYCHQFRTSILYRSTVK